MATRFSILVLLTLAFTCLFGQNNPDTLFVFVGEKLSIKKLPRPKDSSFGIIYSYDNYKAKYKIIQSIYGNYENRIIEFNSNDNYGVPVFSYTKYALLFVFKHNGKYQHVRFQYFDVYKTTNGRWASCGDPFYFDEKYKDSIKTPIPIVKLDFPKPVTFKINPARDSAALKEVFPEPYFKVEGLTATGLMGSYVDDLFVVKKEGILRQLGYFK